MWKWLIPVVVALLAGAGLLFAAVQDPSASVDPLTVPGGSTQVIIPVNAPCQGTAPPKEGYQHVIWIVLGTREPTT